MYLLVIQLGFEPRTQIPQSLKLMLVLFLIYYLPLDFRLGHDMLIEFGWVCCGQWLKVLAMREHA